MKVWAENMQEGYVVTVSGCDNPMWVKFEFAHFTLRVSEVRGIAVISSPDACLAIHPRADNTIEIDRR